jgi:hypothetical protein
MVLTCGFGAGQRGLADVDSADLNGVSGVGPEDSASDDLGLHGDP